MAVASIPLRLYGLMGCPHCADAEKFLNEKKVLHGTQIVVADGDAVVIAGVKRVIGEENPQFPILVSFITNEIVKGFNKEAYERIIEVFTAMFGTGAPNPPVAQGDNSGQAAQVVASAAPAPEGAAELPSVPGSVDSGIDTIAPVLAG